MSQQNFPCIKTLVGRFHSWAESPDCIYLSYHTLLTQNEQSIDLYHNALKMKIKWIVTTVFAPFKEKLKKKK